jgi:hypothetical protein
MGRVSKFIFALAQEIFCIYHDGEDHADHSNAEYWGPVREPNDRLEGNTRGKNRHTEVQKTAYDVREGRNAPHQTGFEPQIQVLHI